MAADGTGRRSQLPFVAGLLLVLASIPLGWFLFLREPPAPVKLPPPPVVVVPDAGPRAVEIRLGALEGTVEIRKERVLKVRPLTEEAAAAARSTDDDEG